MAQSPENIKAFVFDIDGVFTDSMTLCNTDGVALRMFNEKDAFALRMASMKGYPVGVITGGRTQAVVDRLAFFGVRREDVFLMAKDKSKAFADFLSRHSLSASEVLYIGDDIPDIVLLKAAGIGIAPSDAADEAKEAADIVSEYAGGKQCVRKAVELVLKARNDWKFDVGVYESSTIW